MTFYVLPWFLILDPLGLLQCLFTELHKLQNMSGRPYVTNRISETEGKIREAQGSGWLHCCRYTDPDDSDALLIYNFCYDKQLLLSLVE